MILVVESGSTKADWMLIDKNKRTPYSSIGFNPFFHSKEDILLELNEHLELDLIKKDIQKIFFYGAGCSSKKLNKIIENGLSAFFQNAEVFVEHDLMACAVSLYQNEPFIACILGTGSNSCFFDGKKLREDSYALGYILGDEGSGSYFGKRMLSDFLYNRLPDRMMQEFTRLGVTKEKIFENIYMKENANVFIASFMPILIRNRELDYAQNIIKLGISDFLDKHVKCYKEYKSVPVSFVGSVASLLQEELKEVCNSNGIKLGQIIRRPLENLVNYHMDILSINTKKINISINKN